MIHQILKAFEQLDEIEAIALGGSRAGGCFDEKSDYDIYLYCTGVIPAQVREGILSEFCSHLELGNSFWELEDNGTLKNGVDFDILYRNLDDFIADVACVVEGHQARNGYTTCMWHNLRTCTVLFDRNGRLTQVKRRFDVPYPERLKENIIARNRALLSGNLPSYDGQIAKAAGRGDLVSINHRTAAFLESYFDIIFALNGQTHPGEKRLMRLCLEKCGLLPERFEENLTLLFGVMFTDPKALNAVIGEMVAALDALLERQGEA